MSNVGGHTLRTNDNRPSFASKGAVRNCVPFTVKYLRCCLACVSEEAVGHAWASDVRTRLFALNNSCA